MISLNESSGELIWDGTVIAQLSSSEIQVLQCLLERADELVEKEILLEAGWPSKVVQQNSLTVAIKNIRKALAEITDGPIIETRHRKGYIFHPAASHNIALDSSIDNFSSNQESSTEAISSDSIHEQNIYKPSAILANIIFYSAFTALALWSLFITTLDTPIHCNKINKANLCGYSELSDADIKYIEQTVGESEGTYLYGYDKELDQLQIHKMD
ncbi:winged helix-turn-helix domain-containing protein [Aeromonas jandaei]|uniref:winged helix-turn-helix domain-containing protein n=1 Tax=Aeromonas jandaei TaxID=650 RepID=UPI00191D6B0A|nr:winged helix-turn-helix domain-containing protein [Aeromonas jandaei]MBL0609856.1 winged helix-turn-helix domain-containing protein [Aeromonas jandaei]